MVEAVGGGSIRQAVVPAAGRGTRLIPLTKSQPKEMLPVGRKPTIQHVVEELLGVGVQKILIVTGWQKRAIEDHFDLDHGGLDAENSLGEDAGCLKREDLNEILHYIRQRERRGLGDAIRYAEGFAGSEPFLVALGDTLFFTPSVYPPLLHRLVACYLEHPQASVIAVQHVEAEATVRYGIVKPTHDDLDPTLPFEIADIVEKPVPQQAPSRWAVAARYILHPGVFGQLRRIPPGVNGELQLTDAIRAMMREGHPVWCVPLQPGEQRYDIGNFESYFKAFLDMALRDESVGVNLCEHLQRLLGEQKGKEDG